MIRSLAHGMSLPLCYFLQKIEVEGPAEASRKLSDELKHLGLHLEMRVVVILSHGVGVSLEPSSEYGKDIIEELASRCESQLCQENGCNFNGIMCARCGSYLIGRA